MWNKKGLNIRPRVITAHLIVALALVEVVEGEQVTAHIAAWECGVENPEDKNLQHL